ncbi:PREDICTED: olfactory receptor 11L1-like [Thamnophis sirtalis]|uniref:Olfactory receptor n=1 Tax=Thamnophis sirtalis TaxID=35019 RepID=A0A6I9X7H2_9SAUR|nr:PREDICTED: olfactory receptor 11L1-like [Thamnophis sirtalis]XP_032091929.1 olfactory receptor 11L1-like [Thamnophis elegans]
MEHRRDNNQTVIKEFILLGFGDISEFQILLFLVFLVIYLVTMLGNVLIIVLTVTDYHLHTPMYLFLINLSCLEICYISTISPRMLDSFLTGNQLMQLNSCFTQLYFFGGLATAECYLLSAMSYDRYLAVCKPLHYVTIMNMKTCLQLAGCSWIIGFLVNSMPTYLIKQLVFCGPNVIDHFFCDFTPLLQVSCSNTMKIQLLIFILSVLFGLLPFLLTLVSYGYIVKTILRIPSTVGRKKTFSTCSSHLTVVSLFYGTIVIVYVLPKTKTLRDLNKICSVFYTILIPLVNPFVYSLRNKDIKQALRKAINHFSV